MLGGAEYLVSLYFLFYIHLFYLTWRIGWGLYQITRDGWCCESLAPSLHVVRTLICFILALSILSCSVNRERIIWKLCCVTTTFLWSSQGLQNKNPTFPPIVNSNGTITYACAKYLLAVMIYAFFVGWQEARISNESYWQYYKTWDSENAKYSFKVSAWQLSWLSRALTDSETNWVCVLIVLHIRKDKRKDFILGNLDKNDIFTMRSYIPQKDFLPLILYEKQVLIIQFIKACGWIKTHRLKKNAYFGRSGMKRE